MKRLFIFFIFIALFKLFFPINPYIECNHLTIITKIEVDCGSSYHITYIETLPVKENNGIEYHSKKYQIQDTNLLRGITRIEKDKNIYKKGAKIIIRCSNKDLIQKILKET